jgi:hypothetical protein
MCLRDAACAVAVAVFLLSPLSAENSRNIDFFGVVSKDADNSMVKMTENLYLTQLGEIAGLSVIDKRNSGFIQTYFQDGKPDFSEASSPLIFYAVIEKNSDDEGRWICTLNIADSATGDIHSYRKEYDSFYKILMESKQSLQSVFEQLLKTGHTMEQSESNYQNNSTVQKLQISTDSVAGTWSGEEYIDKIIILRGGRGFIIYKNGATMNITVSVNVQTETVIIVQSGKSNASFFSELPRKTALEAATTASPIQWNFRQEDNKTLTGTKTTLILSGDTAKTGTLPVTWTRK